MTLDVLQAPELDGVEVYSEFLSLGNGEHYGFDQVFQPEASEPGQTGVT